MNKYLKEQLKETRRSLLDMIEQLKQKEEKCEKLEIDYSLERRTTQGK